MINSRFNPWRRQSYPCFGIAEIRNNSGGDDSLWLYTATRKNQSMSVMLSTSCNWGKTLKTEAATKNVRDLRGVKKSDVKTRSCSAFIDPFCLACVCVLVFREELEFGPHGAFLGLVPKGGFFFWSCCDPVDQARSMYLKVDKVEVGQCDWGNGKRGATVPAHRPPPHPPLHST